MQEKVEKVLKSVIFDEVKSSETLIGVYAETTSPIILDLHISN